MTRKPDNSWLMCTRPNPGASLRLFCFPYAGGGAPVFREWADNLPASVEVCAVQLPGRGSRLQETPFNRITPLARTLGEALCSHLDKPFAFFGHSLGALVGFELARELRRCHHLLPVHLFVSGCGAPHKPYPHPQVHALPDSEFLEELRQLNGTPSVVLENRELMPLLLPVLRADFAAQETYVYADEPLLDCPISAFGGTQDRRVGLDYLEAWRDQTSGSFSLHMLPGDHFFLMTSRSRLLQMLSRELERHGNS